MTSGPNFTIRSSPRPITKPRRLLLRLEAHFCRKNFDIDRKRINFANFLGLDTGYNPLLRSEDRKEASNAHALAETPALNVHKPSKSG